jgi:hypothetical protein
LSVISSISVGGCVEAYPHRLGAACQEVRDPVAEGGVQSQGPELGDYLFIWTMVLIAEL